MRHISQTSIVVLALGVFAGVGGGMGHLAASKQLAACEATPLAGQSFTYGPGLSASCGRRWEHAEHRTCCLK